MIFYYDDEQKRQAEETRDHFNSILKAAGRNACSTEIKPAVEYYLAEDYRKLIPQSTISSLNPKAQKRASGF